MKCTTKVEPKIKHFCKSSREKSKMKHDLIVAIIATNIRKIGNLKIRKTSLRHIYVPDSISFL